MKKIVLALFCVLALALPVFAQESFNDRISTLEANNAAVLAMLSRQKADIANLDAKIQEVSDKLDALTKAVAPKATFQASTVDVWGRGNPASFTSTGAAVSAPMMMSGYSSGMSMSSGRRGILGRRGGSCGAGG